MADVADYWRGGQVTGDEAREGKSRKIPGGGRKNGGKARARVPAANTWSRGQCWDERGGSVSTMVFFGCGGF